MKYCICMAFGWYIGSGISLLGQSSMVISSTGGNFEGDNMRVYWSVGELCVSKEYSKPFTVHEGFLQGVDSWADLSTGERDERSDILGKRVRYYPNPVHHYLNIEDEDRHVYRGVLFDESGNYLLEFFREEDTEFLLLGMEMYPEGAYFIRLYDNKAQLITRFRIVKRNR